MIARPSLPLLSSLEDVLEERIRFLDPELRSAHNRIDVLETCSESNAKTIDRLERELQEGDIALIGGYGIDQILVRTCFLSQKWDLWKEVGS